jgi:hypothetical protein
MTSGYRGGLAHADHVQGRFDRADPEHSSQRVVVEGGDRHGRQA